MSLDWDVGFKTIPFLAELDVFMLSLGYSIDEDPKSYTRIYQWLPQDDAPKNHREVIFYYNDVIDSDCIHFFPDVDRNGILAYGSLVAPATEQTYMWFEQRPAVIR